VRLVQTSREATSGVPDYLPDAVSPGKRILVPFSRREQIQFRHTSCPNSSLHDYSYDAYGFQFSYVSALRRISKTAWRASVYAPKRVADLSAPELSMPKMRKLMDDTRAPMQPQLWRLQDLRDGGLVYTLELFIIDSIKSSSKAVLDDPSRELYFLAITRK
jgi:hypothetical protein